MKKVTNMHPCVLRWRRGRPCHVVHTQTQVAVEHYPCSLASRPHLWQPGAATQSSCPARDKGLFWEARLRRLESKMLIGISCIEARCGASSCRSRRHPAGPYLSFQNVLSPLSVTLNSSASSCLCVCLWPPREGNGEQAFGQPPHRGAHTGLVRLPVPPSFHVGFVV